MQSLRDIKRKMRLDLHNAMKVEALYIVGNDVPIPVTVRIHVPKDPEFIGDLDNTNYSYASRVAIIPKIVFLRSEIDKPRRNAIISVEVGEAYTIDFVEAPDDITIKAHVTRITDPSVLEELPIPGGSNSQVPVLPDGYNYILDDDEAFIVDDDQAYIVADENP